MNRYLVRRLFLSLLVLAGVSVLTFLILHLVPGDPVYAIAGRQAVTAESAAAMREALGLNDPLPVQYGRFIENILSGNLGTSIRSQRPVVSMIAEQLPSTVQLTLASMAIATALGLTVGIVSALNRGRWIDRMLTLVIIAGVSMPTFWLGILLILLFSVQLHWLPSAAPASDPRSLILPALTLGLAEAAVIARIVRASMIDVLDQSYLTVAYAKGLRERRITWRHALPNALIPIISILGLQFGLLLSGSVVVEALFARPGLGRLTVTAINTRDFPLIQGIVLVIAVLYLLVNTLTDILYVVVNPRIRLS